MLKINPQNDLQNWDWVVALAYVLFVLPSAVV